MAYWIGPSNKNVLISFYERNFINLMKYCVMFLLEKIDLLWLFVVNKVKSSIKS